MSIPLIISLFITSLYSVIDAIWVSGLGADALAGVGFVSPIFIALMGIGNGLGAGSASALSKYIGENNKEKATSKIYNDKYVDSCAKNMFCTHLFPLSTFGKQKPGNQDQDC